MAPTAEHPDSEKITINLTPVDLGKIDLLVAEGLFHNRSDLIRTAVRRQLDDHVKIIDDRSQRHSAVVGTVNYDAAYFERLRAKGATTSIKVIGRCVINNDVSPELAEQTIESLTVYGVLRASDDVLKAIKSRRLALLVGGQRVLTKTTDIDS